MATHSEQIAAVEQFMFFLMETMNHIEDRFEQTEGCSPDETRVLYLLSKQGPLMIKEIAQGMPGVSLSKLTRVLDSLETQGCIIRSLNRDDRRSFRITPTDRGLQLISGLFRQIEMFAQGTLNALTPAERLILIELFAKVQANWRLPSENSSAELGSAGNSSRAHER
jgi:DNA-binding MarR family transcriptional regulator